MKRPVKLGIASLKAFGAVFVLGAVAHASMSYLPLIGPPPLRVQVMKSPVAAPAVVKFAAAPALTASNSQATAEASIASVVTNLTVPSIPAIYGPFLTPAPDQSLGDTFTASVFTMPTPDLLGITPQMLAAYLHPVQFGTNSTTLIGPFHVSFTPPLPPDKSSHAEYIIK
jgi:hypothetical protein